MRRRPRDLGFICVLALVLASCLRVPGGGGDVPGAAAAPTTADEVIARHVAALGGAKLLRALGQRTVEARTVFHAEKGCEGDEQCFGEEQRGSFYLYNTGDGRLYRRSVLGSFVDERGFDGRSGWKLQNGVLALDDDDELIGSREDALLHWYFDVGARGIRTKLAGVRNKDHAGQGRVLDGVRWQHEGDGIPPKTLWFDRSTGLLREEIIEEKIGDELNSQVIVYDDYRAVDGVKIAHRVGLHTARGKRSQLVEFVTQRVDHRKDPTVAFAAPELPAPDPLPDALLAQLVSTRRAAEAAPRDAVAQLEHARASWAAAHFDEAERSAKAVLAVDAGEPEAVWLLARALILRGRLEEAGRQLARAEKLGVRADAIAVQRAWIEIRRLRYPALAKAFEDAGSPIHASRFRSFAGTPLALTATGACVVELPLLSDSPPVIQIRMGDQITRAIVDTGAENLIVSNELAARLGLVAQGKTALAPGAPEAGYGQLPELGLGSATVRNVPVDLFPAEQLSQMAGEQPGKTATVEAVVGVRVLERFQVTLDRERKVVDLVPRLARCKKAASERRRGDGVPFYLYESHFMYVLAQMNDAEGLYLFNTGIRGAALTANTTAFGHAAVGAPTLSPGKAALVHIGRFTVGRHTAEGLEAAWGYLQQDKTGDGFRLDGMIGLQAVPTKRVTVDFDEHRLYLGGTG